jgi:hypothetical protein
MVVCYCDPGAVFGRDSVMIVSQTQILDYDIRASIRPYPYSFVIFAHEHGAIAIERDSACSYRDSVRKEVDARRQDRVFSQNHAVRRGQQFTRQAASS